MKTLKIILALTLCLTLTGCGSKHDELLELVDNKDYQGAIDYINQLAYEDAKNNGEIKETDLTAILIDEWTLYENEKDNTDISKVTFNKDSTVYLDDQKYLWEVESENEEYLSINILDGASKFAKANLNKDSSYCLSLEIYDAESKGYSNYRNFFSDANYERIEITLDNWQTYFEIKDYYHFSKDAFDEINYLSYAQVLQLKDEYFDKLLLANCKVAYELSYDEYKWGIDIDFANQQATLKNKIEKNQTYQRKGQLINNSMYSTQYFGTEFFSISESVDYYDQIINKADNIKMERIQGHFYLSK